jgi:hypothetical protein
MILPPLVPDFSNSEAPFSPSKETISSLFSFLSFVRSSYLTSSQMREAVQAKTAIATSIVNLYFSLFSIIIL